MLHDIICPLCMKRFPANNVVFRHSDAGLRAAGRDLQAYRVPDIYRKAYYARHAIPVADAMELKTVDPAYFPEEEKFYSDGLLTSLRCAEGYTMSDQVCPFCHGKLYAGAGSMPMQQMAIIGGSNSGKTTFEAAMIYQLTRSGIGCINNTLNGKGGIDSAVENNIRILRKGSQEKLEKLQQGAVSEWSATENYHGPYIFQITPGQGSDSFALAFYDLPGEQFRNDIEMVRRRAPYIATAKTCLCLVDLNDITTVTDVIAALSTHFGHGMKENGVNLALVLYKADLLSRAVDGITQVVTPMQIAANAPVDMNLIEYASKQLEQFVVAREGHLKGAYASICALLGAENVRLFIAQAFDENGDFDPRGCEVPLLWSLARQGIYPHTH